jgi:serine/threonine protein kinase
VAHERVLRNTEPGPRPAAGIEDLVQAPLKVRQCKPGPWISCGFLKHLCKTHGSGIARVVGCLSENTIQELVGGALSGDARTRAHLHIETCVACRMLVIELARDGDLEGISHPNERLPNDLFAGALLRTVANIEDPATPAHDLVDPGAVIGHYRIVRRIGRGAMGVVYEAEDPQLSRSVALKVLVPLRASDGERRRRFRREARAAAAVVHPNVAAMYGVGHERGLEYLAMEYVTGTTLREAMRHRGGPFEIADVARIGEAIASGVGRAHELGIVHRDLKPENVMIADTGAVKVLDFGLAKLLDPPASARDELPWSSHTMTLDGHILGTPTYMSPEQSKGRPVDARTDVFALGVLLYELATGSRPFCGETAVELFIAIDRDEPPPPSTLNPRVSPALEAIVLRCLRKSPDERFASCREAAEALRRVSSGEDPALATVASGAELRLASIVRVTLPPADSSSADVLSQERAALVDLLAGYGASATVFAGGSLVATFLLRPTGARAATDLAVQAARCAFAARDATPDGAIVIATGRALLVGSTPTGEAADRAAAISTRAIGAAILLDELSAGLLDGRCRVRELGAGVFALDRAVLAADETRPLLGRPTPCVGRDAELATLDIALGACRDEGMPRAVLVVAPPGQGKTRLCHEWLRRTEASTDPPLVLVGRADPVRGAVGGLLAQALRPALDVAEGVAPDEARGALLAAVSRRVPASDALRVAEMLGELCGVLFSDEGRVLLRSARNDPPTMAEQVERAWLEWLRATCAARTVVIVLEDLHWGDARTVSLVEAALRELTEGALLVLALARPEVDERFPELWGGRAQRIVLGPLGRKASERLGREVLGSAADLALVERIVRLSEGNALFLEELVRAAAEDSDCGCGAPSTLIAMLQARIERLAPEERLVLRVASVLGERFRDGDVGALLGEDELKLDGWLRGLAQREVLAVHRDGARAEHRFRHALVREAAYGTLPEPERRALHRAAAEHLAQTITEPAVVAEHFERAGLPERAVPFYRDAAARALDSFENHGAIRWARRGLLCGAEGDLRGVLLAIDASAHFASNVFDDAHASALEAMSLVQPGTWAFCESTGVAIVTAVAGDSTSERDRVPKLIATVMQIEPHPDARRTYARVLALVLTALCATVPRDRIAPMFARLRAVCDLLTPSDPTAQRWFSWASSAAMIYEPAPWRALQTAEACLRDARLSGDRFVEQWVLANFYELQWWWLGDAAAEDRLRAQLQGAIHRKVLMLQATSAIHLVRIACDKSDPTAVAEGARQMRLLAEDPHSSALVAGQAYEHWARIELHEGRAAVALAERSRKMMASAPLFALSATATLARALIAEGRVVDAVRVAHEGLSVVAEFGGAGFFEVDMRLAACEAFFAAGDGERARTELHEALHQIPIRAEDIEDLGWRRSYLTRNAENRRARALAEAWGVTDPTAALLSDS